MKCLECKKEIPIMEVLCVKCSKQFLKDTMSDKEYQDLMRENEELNE